MTFGDIIMAGLPQNIPQSWREPFPENGELEVVSFELDGILVA